LISHIRVVFTASGETTTVDEDDDETKKEGSGDEETPADETGKQEFQ